MDTQLLGLLSQIERHLSAIADYAQTLHVQTTGEKVHEVGSWVLSVTSQGDPCAYLYSTHPGLQYRVCVVYTERFGELPFDPTIASRTYDGEAAPTREGAGKKGYLNACQPFKVSLLPTGQQTDNGHAIYRFNRVLDAAPAPSLPSAPSAVQSPPAHNGHRPKPAAPDLTQAFVALADALSISNERRGALLRSYAGDYAAAIAELETLRDAPDFDDLSPASADPAVAARLAALPVRAEPSPDQAILDNIRERVERKIADFPGQATDQQYGLWCGLVTAAFGKDEDARLARRQVTARLAGVTVGEAHDDWRPSKAQVAAWLDWLCAVDATGKAIRPYCVAHNRLANLETIRRAAANVPAETPQF